MVEIQEKVQMKYDGGPFVPIPDDLLGTSDAGRFLRLRVSHAGICKLLSGSKWADLYKQVKNPSLSMGPNYKNLLDEIQLQYHHEAKKVLKSDADSAGAGGSAGGADFFENEGQQAENVRAKKVLPEDMPPVLEVMLDGKPVKVVTPQSFRNMVALVLVEEDNLKNCFDYLSEDIPKCWGDDGLQQKRKYRRKS